VSRKSRIGDSCYSTCCREIITTADIKFDAKSNLLIIFVPLQLLLRWCVWWYACSHVMTERDASRERRRNSLRFGRSSRQIFNARRRRQFRNFLFMLPTQQFFEVVHGERTPEMNDAGTVYPANIRLHSSLTKSIMRRRRLVCAGHL